MKYLLHRKPDGEVTENDPLLVRDAHQLRGLLANRPDPDATEITPGVTLYWAVDDGWIYASDGTTWKQVIPVGAWT